MSRNPAGGGRTARAEYIADSVGEEELAIAIVPVQDELAHTRQVLRDVIYRVHNTYHGEGVAKPPWYRCHRTVCREAQALLQVEKDE